jgi:hypothetical protein
MGWKHSGSAKFLPVLLRGFNLYLSRAGSQSDGSDFNGQRNGDHDLRYPLIRSRYTKLDILAMALKVIKEFSFELTDILPKHWSDDAIAGWISPER